MDLLRAGLNPTMTDEETKELSKRDTEDALSRVELPLLGTKVGESLLEVVNQSSWILGLDHHIINIGLYIMTDLLT